MKTTRYRPLCYLALFALLLLAGGCGDDVEAPLYQDKFDDPGSGWGKDEREGEYLRGYGDGEYVFFIEKPNWLLWATPGRDRLEDVSIRVETRVSSDMSEGHAGVLCRYQNEENFYYLAISPDGYYAIFRRVEGEDLTVISDDGSGMMFSPAIRTEGEVNVIQVVCQGNKLSLRVNGESVTSVRDDALDRGSVGLGAGSGPAGGFEVQFDDFLVANP